MRQQWVSPLRQCRLSLARTGKWVYNSQWRVRVHSFRQPAATAQRATPRCHRQCCAGTGFHAHGPASSTPPAASRAQWCGSMAECPEQHARQVAQPVKTCLKHTQAHKQARTRTHARTHARERARKKNASKHMSQDQSWLECTPALNAPMPFRACGGAGDSKQAACQPAHARDATQNLRLRHHTAQPL